jgi:proline iminopeptidase
VIVRVESVAMPDGAALQLRTAMWNDQLRVNLRCNQELAADRSRDEPQLARQCAQLDLPVLILHGADDPRPVWATNSLLEALPNARRIVIEHAGHLPWVEQPSAIANEIRSFVPRQPPG